MKATALLTAIRPTLCSEFFSTRQLAVLMILFTERSGMDFSAIAANLDVSKPSISRSLDTLGILKFTKRERRPKDARRVVVSLTADGRKFVKSMLMAV